MKKYIICAFLLLSQIIGITTVGNAQNAITFNPDHTNNADLVLLGKVWGMLKYHHPAVIKGAYKWDEELIKLLPEYNACKNKSDRNVLLYKWISNLGAVPATQPIPDSLLNNAKLKPDFTWIKESGLSTQLISLLMQISQYHSTGDQQYLKFMALDNVALAVFVNENAYASMAYPDAGYRLLAAYRYWNIIEYGYPYKYLSKPKWADCLKTFITEALAANNETEYLHFIQKMVGAIRDSHAVVSSARLQRMLGLWFTPFTVKFIEDKAVINAVNHKLLADTSIKVGSIVEAVNGVAVNKMMADEAPYISASNHAVVLREGARFITRSADSVNKITIKGENGLSKVYTIKYGHTAQYGIYFTDDFAYQKDSGCFVLPSNVLYVNAGAFKASQVDFVKKELKTVKGLVLDARQYPRTGAGNVITLLQQFLLADKGAMAKFSSLVVGYPGLFRFSSPFVIGDADKDYYKGKVVILVNEETQSTSEFLTMAYQLAPKAIVVGSTTAGADGNVGPAFPLPGGITTEITGLGVYYPDGKETQQVGIIPDVKIRQTIAGFRHHDDELLDKAVDIIVGGK